MVELNGTELTIEQVMAVARHKEQVRISEPAKQKIDRARAYVDEKLAQKAVIYGLTTGFGKFPIRLSQNRRQPRSSAT